VIFVDALALRNVVQHLGGIAAVAQRLGLPSSAVEYFIERADSLPVWVLDELFTAWEETPGATEENVAGAA